MPWQSRGNRDRETFPQRKVVRDALFSFSCSAVLRIPHQKRYVAAPAGLCSVSCSAWKLSFLCLLQGMKASIHLPLSLLKLGLLFFFWVLCAPLVVPVSRTY